MKIIDSLLKHRSEGKAILACNFYNAETLMAILQAAKELNTEIILQTSPSTLNYLGINLAASMARSAARQFGVQAWLHLDHARDPDLIHQCIDAGYDSVMIDASESDLETNIKTTSEIVARAHSSGIAVEAELGYIPKLRQSGVTEEGLTNPDEALRFVNETGVDLLAIAIGTAHGFYKKEPMLNLDRLSGIRKTVDTPLVLHGGSGLSGDMWQETINRGIVKINFATEIKDTFTKAVKQVLNEGDEIDLRKTFPSAINMVKQLVIRKIKTCSMLDS